LKKYIDIDLILLGSFPDPDPPFDKEKLAKISKQYLKIARTIAGSEKDQ
jgi:hypothetical protein